MGGGDYDPAAERYWRTVPVASTACYCTGACRTTGGCPHAWRSHILTGDPPGSGPFHFPAPPPEQPAVFIGGTWPAAVKPRYRVKAGRQVVP